VLAKLAVAATILPLSVLTAVHTELGRLLVGRSSAVLTWWTPVVSTVPNLPVPYRIRNVVGVVLVRPPRTGPIRCIRGFQNCSKTWYRGTRTPTPSEGDDSLGKTSSWTGTTTVTGTPPLSRPRASPIPPISSAQRSSIPWHGKLAHPYVPARWALPG